MCSKTSAGTNIVWIFATAIQLYVFKYLKTSSTKYYACLMVYYKVIVCVGFLNMSVQCINTQHISIHWIYAHAFISYAKIFKK